MEDTLPQLKKGSGLKIEGLNRTNETGLTYGHILCKCKPSRIESNGKSFEKTVDRSSTKKKERLRLVSHVI